MFDSLLNFRPIGGSLFYKHDPQIDANYLNIRAYRCARPDNVTSEDLESLQTQLGIRSVIDLRNYKDEYPKETGMKLLDNTISGVSTLKVVDMEKIEKLKSRELLWIDNGGNSEHSYINTINSPVNHYMINLIGRGFVANMLKDTRLPLWKRIWGFVLLVLYVLFKSNYFVKFVRREIDKNGLLNLYKSIVDYSGISLRCALQVINQPKNIPCIVCCHAGKDRTGVLCAILLSLCGYDKDTISDDFAVSEIGLPITHKEMHEYDECMRHAPRHVMYELLEYIDGKYGSMSQYLTSIGFSLVDQDRLRKYLTGTS